jgi:hypothetical protein
MRGSAIWKGPSSLPKLRKKGSSELHLRRHMATRKARLITPPPKQTEKVMQKKRTRDQERKFHGRHRLHSITGVLARQGRLLVYPCQRKHLPVLGPQLYLGLRT